MSRRKRASAADEMYIAHLYGGRTAYNPTTHRVGMIERMYIRILTELAVNRFEWKGMPDTVSLRFLELTLFNKALAIFYDDNDFGQLALPGSPDMMLNHYGDPIAYQVIGANNFIRKRVSAKECVPIWANTLRAPDLDIVGIYASRLADLDRTFEINAKSARRTKIMAITENQVLSAENMIRQIDEGQAVITIANNFDLNAVLQNIDLGVDPESLERLHIARTRQFNECMGLLGINNSNQDKKERLVEAEVAGNDDQIEAMRNVNLNERKRAAEKINDMFGLNVSVDFYKSDVAPAQDVDDNEDNEDETEGDDE